jgi:hypothetical protein
MTTIGVPTHVTAYEAASLSPPQIMCHFIVAYFSMPLFYATRYLLTIINYLMWHLGVMHYYFVLGHIYYLSFHMSFHCLMI